MKKSILWKSLFVGIAALLAFGILMGSCSDDSAGGAQPSTASFNGIVVDALTGLANSGVTVKIAGKTVRTDADGYYSVKGITAGTHTALYIKEAYETIEAEVEVNADQYLEDKAFYDVEYLRSSLEAKWEVVTAWMEKYNQSGSLAYPALTVNGGDVTALGPDLFQYFANDLDTSYEYAKKITVTTLPPLTGEAKALIKLVSFPAADLETRLVDEATDISVEAGVQVWAKWNNRLYGPFATTGDGTVALTGLPAGKELTLFIGNYTSAAGKFYSGDKAASVMIYDSASEAFDVLDTFTPEVVASDLKTVYVFADGTFTFVKSADLGTAELPHYANQPVTVTFNSAVNPQGFGATFGGDDLKWTLNADKTIASFIPAAGKWTYATNAQVSTGEIVLSGYAADGSKIYVGDEALPVYIEEGLKIVSVDRAATMNRAVVTGSAIKLTFNKEVDISQATFTIGGATADALIGADTKEVFVSSSLLIYSPKTLAMSGVISSVRDSDDAIDDGTGATGFSTLLNAVADTEYNLSTPAKLSVASTNLYSKGATALAEYDVAQGIDRDSNLTISFNTTIPPGAKVTISGTATTFVDVTDYTDNGDGSYSFTISGTRSAITLSNDSNMAYGTGYSLGVVINHNGTDIFTTSDGGVNRLFYSNGSVYNFYTAVAP